MKLPARKIVRMLLTWALIVFALPQAFVCIYYFPAFFRSSGSFIGLSKALTKYAFCISWVSAPVLTLIYAAFCAGMRRRLKAPILLAACLATGFAWVLAWNVLVYPTFGLLRSLIPLSICGVVSWGYAMGSELARESAQLVAKSQEPPQPSPPSAQTPPPPAQTPPPPAQSTPPSAQTPPPSAPPPAAAR